MTPEEIFDLLLPYSDERRTEFENGKRLAHYTSAAAAYQILTNQEVWLRNASMMNDFSEIQHGIDCLGAAWRSRGGKQLREMLDRIEPGLSERIARLFDSNSFILQQNTFIVSLSEHDDNEDDYGRLSMWRAYGGSSGVALILNPTAFLSDTDEMKVFSAPVLYKSEVQFVEWFQDWATAVGKAEKELKGLGAETINNWIFGVFRIFALSTKHPGFSEEKEWRVFHSPDYEGASPWVRSEIEIIKGIPQKIVKLKLFDDPNKSIMGVAPSRLVNRVIIGPCDYPLQVRDTIVAALEKAEVEDAANKVTISLIPLKHA
ncbi:DUF2971 domain-containing protein [Aquidulcibacter sp.]|uniref:DUF2971 domain-containing protein n=1 Tax=Aquidulcibacter sp. TaxID=2052990 RepID=UPI0025BA1370|nr:DUF2971 domain-containing protein [Aquidulcibacter sp.]MCA3693759.1 DUF2971 domain-containing protein [Aquidulcibacter sp.]